MDGNISDENLDYLRKLPEEPLEEEDLVETMDLSKLQAGKSLSFETHATEVVETEGYKSFPEKENQSAFPDMLIKKMKVHCMDKKRRQILEEMIGPYDDIEKLMTNVLPDGSVKKVMLEPGTGDEVKNGHLVFCHYIIYVEYGDEPLGTSYQYSESRPQRYRVGKGECIQVMDVGLATMRVGERSKFLGTSSAAYGPIGIPGSGIPPDSRVMVLLEVWETHEDNIDRTILTMSTEERRSLPFDQVVAHLEALKDRGNLEWNNGDSYAALKIYDEVYDCTADLDPKTKAQWQKFRELAVKVCNNLSLTYYTMGKYKQALNAGKIGEKVKCREMRLHAKALYNCAKALMQLRRFDEAAEYCKKSYSMVPGDENVYFLGHKIREKAIEQEEADKQLARKMFGKEEQCATEMAASEISKPLKDIRLEK